MFTPEVDLEKKKKKAFPTFMTMRTFARDNILALKVNANKCSFLQESFEVCRHDMLWIIALWFSS